METLQLPVGDFKSRFSEALEIVARGGTVGVTYGRSKKPVALLVPPTQAPAKRKLGILAGKVKFHIAKEWSLTEEEFLGA
jgi:antitoxin (DNA-binding transcriptional repressor) of toxin-antitoxin stability system